MLILSSRTVTVKYCCSEHFSETYETMGAALIVCASLTLGRFALASDNIALNKPAYQSSTWSKSYSTVPGNVVDGNLDRNVNNGHCTITMTEDLHPWWMVDLGKPYKIHNITIVNRGDEKKEYLHDFYIEMFRLNPLTWNSTTPQHFLFDDGILYDVETLTCDVPVTGRYVRIRKIPRPGQPHSAIIGLEAQKEECGSMDTPIHPGLVLKSSSKQVVGFDSLPDCLSRCLYNLNCYDINYNSHTESCEMILARSDTDVLLDDQDWSFVSLP